MDLGFSAVAMIDTSNYGTQKQVGVVMYVIGIYFMCILYTGMFNILCNRLNREPCLAASFKNFTLTFLCVRFSAIAARLVAT